MSDSRPTPEKRPPGPHLTDEERALAQRKFLVSFAKRANVLLAAKAAKVHRSTIYDWLEHDEDFFFAFNQAKEDAKDVLRAEIYRRGHDGWKESVYEAGVLTKTVRKYSDTLLIFHAKALMPEYREKQQLDVTNHMQVSRDPALQTLTDEEVETLERISNRTAANRE
jgi:hypothetical protein